MNSDISFNHKTVLITGCAGTIGSQLIEELLSLSNPPAKIIGIDINETGLFELKHSTARHSSLHLFCADICNLYDIKKYFSGVDIVLHTAALKHVGLCEHSPGHACSVNVKGLQNVIEATIEAKCERFLFTSSDKAVNPTNVMGTTKLLGEHLVTAANLDPRSRTVFASTRFGNVLGSRGSVVPIFINQVKKSLPVTITDINMTRFIMSIQEACQLVLKSVLLASPGEVLVMKMPVVKIVDLAHAVSYIINGQYLQPAQIKLIGTQAGEKLYEELMTDSETNRTSDCGAFYSIQPSYQSIYSQLNPPAGEGCSSNPSEAYKSSTLDCLNIPEVVRLLEDCAIVNTNLQTYSSRSWPQ